MHPCFQKVHDLARRELFRHFRLGVKHPAGRLTSPIYQARTSDCDVYNEVLKFNKRTGKYVLWCNADNHYTVAVSDTPVGPFTVQNPNVRVEHGDTQGDFGLFVDVDGTGYITYSFCPPNIDWSAKTEPIRHHQICVEKLTPDYLGSTMESTEPIAGNVEAPAMFKRNNIYYLLFDNTCCFGADGSGIALHRLAVRFPWYQSQVF